MTNNNNPMFKWLSLFLLLFAVMSCGEKNTTITPETFNNPILPGFHPDPSICRVGEDYYLINSSFEWFPGVPVYHSCDLVNWEQIGNVLDRPEQLDLEPGHRHNGGIWAPTIRFHDGLFYMITTVAGKGNFYVTAKDPAGPWSDPVWLSSPGIDPSLFWDDDGRCWYTGAFNLNKKPQWPNQNGIFIQELDLKNQELLGEPVQITYGHASNARWTEGPHIYKIDGRYLLMVAEGGTGLDHSVTVFGSDSITGPYISSHTNPVLTHRFLGKDYPLGMMGHADLVETQNGKWWAVLLGRRVKDNLSMLARETFLVPVKFEDGWPVFNPGIGLVQEVERRPDLPWHPFKQHSFRYNFDQEKLAPFWNFLRTPHERWYQLADGNLKIDLRPQQLKGLDNPSLIVRRIEHFDYKATSQLSFSPENMSEEAGMTVFLDNKQHYKLLKTQGKITLVKMDDGVETIVNSVEYSSDRVVLQIEGKMFELTFRYGTDENELKQIGDVQDARVITAKSFIGTGFNGPYIGMYASSGGQPSSNVASFDWFEYIPVKSK